MLNLKPTYLEHLCHRKLGQGDVMIPEIPIGPGDILDIRTKKDDDATGFQAPVRLGNRLLDMGFVRKVLDKIA